MNVIFHVITAIGIAVAITDSKAIEKSVTSRKVIVTSFFAFLVGVISHGALDYIPHCYPINSKIDVILGLAIIIATLWKTNRKYRVIVFFSFLGSVLPDLIDLLPAIANKQLGLDLPIIDKIFPWHLHDYSGSIFKEDCATSTLNHILLLLTLTIDYWSRRGDWRTMFRK